MKNVNVYLPPGRLRLRIMMILIAALVACGTSSITFTEKKDQSVMDELESVWENPEQDAIVLTLCEDKEMSDKWDGQESCQESHVVRGEGRSIEHTEQESSGVGCGGCPFEVLAYVKGTIEGGPFSQAASVAGSVSFGDIYDVDKIFTYPYHVYLTCTGDAPACFSVSGELFEDGHLELEYLKDVNSEYKMFNLSRTGPSGCHAIDE